VRFCVGVSSMTGRLSLSSVSLFDEQCSFGECPTPVCPSQPQRTSFDLRVVKEALADHRLAVKTSVSLVISERLARLLYPQTLIFIGTLTLFMVLLSAFIRHRSTLAIDLKATLHLQKSGNPFWDKVNRWLTFMGNSPTVVGLCLAVLGISYALDSLNVGIYTVATLVSAPLNILLKNIFDRNRPGEDEVKVHPGPRWGFSYPSGHAMISTSFYGFMAVLIWLHIVPMDLRLALMTPFILLPPLISASRMYLGAHWLSDVVGGMSVGMILVTIVSVLYSPM
jgi:membrane-associated phospholipid phosphatase